MVDVIVYNYDVVKCFSVSVSVSVLVIVVLPCILETIRVVFISIYTGSWSDVIVLTVLILLTFRMSLVTAISSVLWVLPLCGSG